MKPAGEIAAHKHPITYAEEVSKPQKPNPLALVKMKAFSSLKGETFPLALKQVPFPQKDKINLALSQELEMMTKFSRAEMRLLNSTKGSV